MRSRARPACPRPTSTAAPHTVLHPSGSPLGFISDSNSAASLLRNEDVGRDDELLAFVRPDVVVRRGVGVVERGCDASLTPDLPAKPSIFSLVDLAHAATAKFFDDSTV